MAEQRLIDANNLIEEIREERCYNCRNFKDMKCDYCGTADYIYMIEDMPAVEAKPVVHGRWIDKEEYAVCTECGGRSGTQYDGVEPIPLMTQFCPNCGAKMDGGIENG